MKSEPFHKLYQIFLWALGSLTIFSLMGFVGFGQFPQLFSLHPSTGAIYGWAFANFGLFHVVAAFLAVAALLIHHAKVQWIVAFLAVYALSFLAEYGGTSIGVPFGHYQYSELLGPKILNHVPIVIPLSWFTMAICSYILVRNRFTTLWGRIFMGALLLTSWDLALDPAMSYLSTYWLWTEPGPYYGMPWINLGGWLLTSLVLMGALELSGVRKWSGSFTVSSALAIYSWNLLLPLGMMLGHGLILGVVIAFAVPATLIWLGLGHTDLKSFRNQTWGMANSLERDPG